MRARRAATVLAIGAALLAPAVAVGNDRFSDVPADAFFHDAVNAISTAGITAGCGGTNYCPANPVTRGEMAVFLMRAAGLGGSTPVANAATAAAATNATNAANAAQWNSVELILFGQADFGGNGQAEACDPNLVHIAANELGFVSSLASPQAVAWFFRFKQPDRMYEICAASLDGDVLQADEIYVATYFTIRTDFFYPAAARGVG